MTTAAPSQDLLSRQGSALYDRRFLPVTFGIALATVAAAGLIPFAEPGLEQAVYSAGVLGVAALTLSRLVHGNAWWLAAPTWFTLPWIIVFFAKPAYDFKTGLVTYNQGIPIVDTYDAAVWAGCLGLCFFQVGYYIVLPRTKPSISSRALVTPDNFLRAAYCAFALVLLLTTAFLAQNSGLATLLAFFSGRSQATNSAYANSSGYLYTAPLWMVSIGLYALGRARSAQVEAKRLRRAGLIFLTFSMTLSIGVGDRSFFVPALLALLLARWMRLGRSPNWLLCVTLLPVVVFFLVLVPRYARQTSTEEQGSVSAAFADLRDPAAAFLAGDDTSMARGLAIAIEGVPETIPYQYGGSYLSILARPIPRQLFPVTKPQSGDALLGETLQKSKTGIQAGFAYSIFAEPYLNGGYVGVAAFSAAFGALWRTAWGALLRRRDSLLAQTLWAISVPLMIVWVRGGINVDFQRQFLYTLPLLLVIAFARRRDGATGRRGDGATARRGDAEMADHCIDRDDAEVLTGN